MSDQLLTICRGPLLWLHWAEPLTARKLPSHCLYLCLATVSLPLWFLLFTSRETILLLCCLNGQNTMGTMSLSDRFITWFNIHNREWPTLIILQYVRHTSCSKYERYLGFHLWDSFYGRTDTKPDSSVKTLCQSGFLRNPTPSSPTGSKNVSHWTEEAVSPTCYFIRSNIISQNF